MNVVYTLVQQEELTLVHNHKEYTRAQLLENDDKELLTIFDELEASGNIYYPDYRVELGGKRVLVGAHACRGNDDITIDLIKGTMKIRRLN